MKAGMLIICLLVLSSEIIPQWEQTNGPEGISINNLYTVGNIIYAGTYGYGVYASTDDGINWIPMNSGIETKKIGAITASPGNLFAGTQGNGIYRSTNGGLTWLPPSTATNLYVYAMTVKDSIVFAATQSGIYLSSDNGITWEFNGYYGSYERLGVTGNKLFASSGSFVYVTTDNGATWSSVNSIYGTFVWSIYCNGNFIIVGGVNEGFISTDQGNNFTLVNIPFEFDNVNIYDIKAIGTTLFAATSYDGVYKSTDMGLTWTPSNTGMGPKDVRTLTVTGSSTLLAGSHYVGVFRSTNSGLSWNRALSGFPPGSTIAGMFAFGTTVLAGTYDGAYRSTNNGLTWNKLTGTNDTINYSLVRGIWQSGDTIFAGTNFKFHGAVYRSTDNGTTWERKSNGLPSNLQFLNSVIITDNNTVLAGSDHSVYYSTDNGNNWVHSNFPDLYIENMAEGGGYEYAACDYIGIYRSSDNGVNWSNTISGLDFLLMSARDNFACVGSVNEGAYVTTDNGLQWFGVSGIPSGNSVYSTYYIPQTTMVLAATNIGTNYIYASYDNGLSFSTYSEGLGINAVTDDFAASDSFMFAGGSFNGVWRRLRPGITPVELSSFTAEESNGNVTLNWTTATEKNNKGFEIQRSDVRNQMSGWRQIGFVEGNGTTTLPHSYSFIDKDLSLSKYSYRLKQFDFDGASEYSNIIEVSIQSPEKFLLEQNFPNPFNPSTKIKYSIPQNAFVTLKIYDILGNEVASLVDENETAGRYNVTFNASKFSSGIYFYKLQAGSFNQIKKMILMK